MSDIVPRSFSSKLRELTSRLRAPNQGLKANTSVSGPALREFRQALDNIRLTAWTVSELQNAKQTNRDTRAAITFLTAERLRRFRQMVTDLCADLKHDGEGWVAQNIEDLQESINELREHLRLLADKRVKSRSDEE